MWHISINTVLYLKNKKKPYPPQMCFVWLGIGKGDANKVDFSLHLVEAFPKNMSTRSKQTKKKSSKYYIYF